MQRVTVMPAGVQPYQLRLDLEIMYFVQVAHPVVRHRYACLLVLFSSLDVTTTRLTIPYFTLQLAPRVSDHM